MSPLVGQVVAVLLLSLRLAPTVAFAPPFTLARVPQTVRVMLCVALSATLVGTYPEQTSQALGGPSAWPAAFATELLVGIILSLGLQLAFGALLTVGRAVDVQAGFGLAALVDPTTHSQMPLVGTIFSYAAGAIFFATDGPVDLLAIWTASLQQLPLGSIPAGNLAGVAGFLSSAFVLACGVGAVLIMALFLADLSIAFMSRTMPQMNVLLLGFQVKTLLTLLLLAPALSLSVAMLLRLVRLGLQAAPGFL